MRLNDIINESSDLDRKYRREAETAYEELLQAFVDMGREEAMKIKGNGLMAPREMLDHPEDIGLVLFDMSMDRRASGGFSDREFGYPVLYLFIDMDRDALMQMRSNEYRKTIIHEFIHSFDAYRMRVMRPTNNLPNDEYYNDPSETNAYYQEAISHFENQMNRIPARTRDMYMQKYGSDFESFLELMSVMLDDSFLKYKSVKTDRALKKRLYQYWDEEVRTGRAFD